MSIVGNQSIYSFVKRVIRSLDRPGGYPFLCAIANGYLRASGSSTSLSFDGKYWVRTTGAGVSAVDLPYFWYSPKALRNFEQLVSRFRSTARDHWFHVYQPKPGDVIVDVGAGAGWDTTEFSRAVNSFGRVIAIEAHPITFDRLQRMCVVNRLQNVKCCCFAAMDRAGTVHIEDGPVDINNRICPPEPGTIPVQARTLDQLLCDTLSLHSIALLKMNIEGAEASALQGAQQTLARTRCAAIATHRFRDERGDEGDFDTRAAVIACLQHHGFQIFTRDRDHRPWVRDHIHGLRPN